MSEQKSFEREFIVRILGEMDENSKVVNYIRSFVPSAEQLKNNPDLKEGKYILVEYIAKPSSKRSLFVSKSKKVANKMEIYNEQDASFDAIADLVLNKQGKEVVSAAGKHYFVLSDTYDFILRSYSCRESYLKQRDGSFLERMFIETRDGKEVRVRRRATRTDFTIIFTPDEWADEVYVTGAVLRERTKVEQYPVTPITSREEDTADLIEDSILDDAEEIEEPEVVAPVAPATAAV